MEIATCTIYGWCFCLGGDPVAMSTPRILEAVLKESRAVGEEEIRVQIQDIGGVGTNHQKPTTNHPNTESCLFADWL